MKKAQTITIKTDEENPMPIEIIAETIKAVSDNMSKALNSGLTLKGICVLVNASLPSNNKIGLKDIELILTTASKLDVFTDGNAPVFRAKNGTPVFIGTIDDMIKSMVTKALAENKTIEKAAAAIGVNQRTMYRYKKEFNIS